MELVKDGVAMFFVVGNGVNQCVHNCVKNGCRKWFALEKAQLSMIWF